MDQLIAASVAAQKLEKKLRQLHNAGKVQTAQLDDAKQVVAILRRLADELGVAVPDLGSRAERAKAKRL